MQKDAKAAERAREKLQSISNGTGEQFGAALGTRMAPRRNCRALHAVTGAVLIKIKSRVVTPCDSRRNDGL
jgi:hypothetical protein